MGKTCYSSVTPVRDAPFRLPFLQAFWLLPRALFFFWGGGWEGLDGWAGQGSFSTWDAIVQMSARGGADIGGQKIQRSVSCLRSNSCIITRKCVQLPSYE